MARHAPLVPPCIAHQRPSHRPAIVIGPRGRHQAAPLLTGQAQPPLVRGPSRPHSWELTTSRSSARAMLATLSERSSSR